MDNTAVKMTESSDEQQILVVVSKLKSYIREKSGMNTAATVSTKITEIIKGLCDEAIVKAKADGRKTLMDRDF